MNRSECFKIQLLEAEKEFYAFDKMKTVSRILFNRLTLFKEPIIIVADPFLFVRGDTLYLFYEQKKLYHDGVIMMTSTKDLQNWAPPRSVLKEPFHLSFPYVFERDGNIYMIPETCANRSIRLYRAVNSELTEFVFVKKLLEMEDDSNVLISYSDSSIWNKDNVTYLFTTVNCGGTNQLRLYYADDLLGPYKEHCKSPVVVSPKHGRNAGSLILYEGELYRPAQDCVHRYGDNVHLWKIIQLTPSEYQEKLFKESIYDKRIPFYREGGHQLNVAQFKGRYIVATDAKEYHWFFAVRIANKLKRMAEKIRHRISFMDILFCDLSQDIDWKELEDYKNQFELVRIGEEDFSALEDLTDAIGEEKVDILERRASEEGYDVYVIRDNWGRSLGYCCRTIKNTWTCEMQKDITVEEDAVYFFDDYISPVYRGRGAHRFSVLQRLEISKKENFKRAQVAILLRNKRSMGNYTPFGFRVNERLLIIKPFHRVISILEKRL